MGCINSKVKKEEPETISISDVLEEISRFNKRKRCYLKRKNNYYLKKSKKSQYQCDVQADDEKRRAFVEESLPVPTLTQEPSNDVSGSEPIVDDTCKHNDVTEVECVCVEESLPVPTLAQEPSNDVSGSEPIVDDTCKHNDVTEVECVCVEESLPVPTLAQEPSNEVSGSEPILDDTSRHDDVTEVECVCVKESLPVPTLAQEPFNEVSGSEPIVDASTEEAGDVYQSFTQEPSNEIISLTPDTTEHDDSTAEEFQYEYDTNSLAVTAFASKPLNDVIPSLPDFSVPSMVQTTFHCVIPSLPGFDYGGGFDINQLVYAGDCVETVTTQNDTNHGEWMSVLESLHMYKKYDPCVDYDMMREIGEGSFGHVYLAKHKQIQEEFAIKKIPLGNTQNQANIVNELEILRVSLHKNIVFLTESYLYDSSVYIITEYIDGLTISNICQMATFSEPAIASITMECLQGLAYLHEGSYVHCDIKGSNILLSKDGKVKLVDFGLAIKTDSPINAGIRGALLWRAPEICNNLPYENKVDIWSLGMVVIEMLQQHPPLYWIQDVNQMLALSQSGYTVLQEDVQPMVSEELLDFLYRGALVVDTNKRLSAHQLTQHPFMMCGDNCESLPGIVKWALQQQQVLH